MPAHAPLKSCFPLLSDLWGQTARSCWTSASSLTGEMRFLPTLPRYSRKYFLVGNDRWWRNAYYRKKWCYIFYTCCFLSNQLRFLHSVVAETKIFIFIVVYFLNKKTSTLWVHCLKSRISLLILFSWMVTCIEFFIENVTANYRYGTCPVSTTTSNAALLVKTRTFDNF